MLILPRLISTIFNDIDATILFASVRYLTRNDAQGELKEKSRKQKTDE